MGLFAKAILAAAAVASVSAIDISVKSDGGNQTGKFGHSYGYGFLHEVSFDDCPLIRILLINEGH
jgi:alpha-N-arabinofuranosidase